MNFFCIRLVFIFCIYSINLSAQHFPTITGTITTQGNTPVEYATVYLKETTYGTSTSSKGVYQLPAPEGKYILVVSSIGYKKKEIPVTIRNKGHHTFNVTMEEDATVLNEVLITGKTKTRQVNELAFNVVALEAKKLHNSSLDLGHALDRISGVRVRESGGVGSSFNFSLNGFTGRQVKFFIDGIPMENFGSSFQINNIPVNLAERIEVYKGVVPINFGADALGGAVNIVTTTRENSYLDASYSYGSFNTHKSYINAGFTSKSGFTAQLNLFQNYSDNNYRVTVDVADLNTGLYAKDQRVKRFHDNYHNETVIANVGVTGKKYADKLLFGITVGQNKADIQTAARMDRVFGARLRKGQIIMPSVKYQKKNIINGLDINITGNYNLGYEQTIDTVARQYNWYGEYREKPEPGSELSRTMYKYRNNSGAFTGNLSYAINEQHSITLNNVFTTFNRKGKDELYPGNELYEQPRKTNKDVIGLGYKFDYNEKLNASVFIKHFIQETSSSITVTNDLGINEYQRYKSPFKATGYGIASTYFPVTAIQIKASYEKSLRLPENEEIFGDANTLEGNIDLKPESSDNINLGLSYNTTIREDHGILIDGNFIFRNAVDYIRPKQNTNGTHQMMSNQRDVLNIGFNGELRYTYKKRLIAGINITYQDVRNNTEYEEGSNTVSTVYKDRMPNIPYLFGNGDASLFFYDVGYKGNNLSFGYNLLYVHEYYLVWPSQGASSTKKTVPGQLSQDVSITYTIKNGRYNISLECRNITDTNLYDNFSLQKPGRSFSAKIRYFISSK